MISLTIVYVIVIVNDNNTTAWSRTCNLSIARITVVIRSVKMSTTGIFIAIKSFIPLFSFYYCLWAAGVFDMVPRQKLSKDELIPAQPQKSDVDLNQVPSRRRGFTIVRGRRMFDHDILSHSAESKSPSRSSEATSHKHGASSGKRNIGWFAMARGR